jgi:hypothetical protein
MGLVESALKDRWLYVTSGPLAGKQFILYKSETTIGSRQESGSHGYGDGEQRRDFVFVGDVGKVAHKELRWLRILAITFSAIGFDAASDRSKEPLSVRILTVLRAESHTIWHVWQWARWFSICARISAATSPSK